MTQYHFLDDSGDPGLSGAEGSSSYFVLAMVQLVERAPLPQLAAIRQQFHFDPTFDFKFYKTKDRHRVAFFGAVRTLPFRVRAVVADKSNLGKAFHKLTGDQLTIEFIVQLATHVPALDLSNDNLVLDGTTPEFRRRLRVRLSQEHRELHRPMPFQKIVSGDSERDDGLQLADMIVGAIRQHVIGAQSDYYQMFADKVVGLWCIPEHEK
jgi:hypothetical protein